MNYLQPQPQSPIGLRKNAVRKYSRNAVVQADNGVVSGAVLGLLARGISLFLILTIVGLVGGFLNWQKAQRIVNYKDPQQMPAQQQLSTEPVRIDVWIWAVRLLRIRSLAIDACRGGHVKVNGEAMKPSVLVVPGDRARLWANHREHVAGVTKAMKERVGALVTRQRYIGHSLPPPPRKILASVPVRGCGAGRPTKRDCHRLGRLRGRRS